jgi:hypothetical protein
VLHPLTDLQKHAPMSTLQSNAPTKICNNCRRKEMNELDP